MTSATNEELNYWPSFVDIFASLFFIFLILFSVYYVSLFKSSEADQRDVEDLLKFTSQNASVTLDTLSMTFQIPADIVFGLNGYKLSAKGKTIASDLGRMFGEYMGQKAYAGDGHPDEIFRYKKYSVIIEGHTDTSGLPSTNNPLSLNRANSLIKAMKANIPAAIRDSIAFIPVGYGELYPKIEPKRDNYPCQGNRRVEIKVLAKFDKTIKSLWDKNNKPK